MSRQQLPNSKANLTLQAALQESALGLHATDPNIAEYRKILDRARFKKLSPSQKNELKQALPVLRAISNAGLAVD